MEPVEHIRSQRPRPPCARPLVTITYAQSLDGSIAVRADAPLALSCPETKRMTHGLRSVHDAILVGINTVLTDDPKLTARRVGGPHPIPVVLDTRLRFPLSARLLDHPRGLIIATGPHPPEEKARALRDRGVTLVELPLGDRGLDLHALLRALAQMDICSLMVEGGARVLATFLRERLADWIVLTVTPHLVGGMPALAEPTIPFRHPPTQVDAFPALADWTWTRMGRDMVIWGKVRWPG
ncbi:MAG: RibD family protein [Chloroflexi bacterium]|nr:RibD family protein [Chloroflexota bacterium]